MNVAAIMPCRGRHEQTVRNVRRLLATAGHEPWLLILTGTPRDLQPIAELANAGRITLLASPGERLTYWQAMALGYVATDQELIANLANDLLPGHQWLGRAVAAYRETFGDGLGMVGFNDGHHETGHSCHFLIHRKLIERYGGWPVWYDHAFGDTELCQRAIVDRLYVKAPWATLFHDHPYFGGQDDAVYAEGRAKADKDHQLYEWRKARGWPAAHP
jgi:hypothetical protein